MNTLKDIFVPYEIAVQLKEIGFDEPCMAYYDLTIMKRRLLIGLKEIVTHANFIRSSLWNIHNINGIDAKEVCSAPTWEQVKKWFREKGYESNVRAYFGCYYGTIGESEDIQLEQEKTYEEAQEKLILKLIEVYKNGKTDI